MLELFDISHIILHYGYIGIFLIVFLESGIFFALPGDSLLFSAGLLASAGILHIYTIIPMIFVATFLGALVGYEIGVHLEKLRKYSLFQKMFKKEYLDKGHKFFDKYGKVTIVFSRFVPIIRTFAPIVAGIVRMHYGTFLRYSLTGSFLWSVIVTLAGFLLGKIIPGLEDYVTPLMLAVVILSILPGVFHLIKNKNAPIVTSE